MELEKQEKPVIPLRITIARICVSLMLVGMAAGLGAYSYTLLKAEERLLADVQFEDSCIIVQEQLTRKLHEKLDVAVLIGNVFINAFKNSSNYPNITYEGFHIFNNTRDGSRAVSFNPIITRATRPEWESYIKLNSTFEKLRTREFEVQLKTGVNNTWPILKGIHQRGSNGDRIASPDAEVIIDKELY